MVVILLPIKLIMSILSSVSEDGCAIAYETRVCRGLKSQVAGSFELEE